MTEASLGSDYPGFGLGRANTNEQTEHDSIPWNQSWNHGIMNRLLVGKLTPDVGIEAWHFFFF